MEAASPFFARRFADMD
ncbi:hypothetical protein [Tritonibacter mobilis]